jgi:hypothetical protein
VRWYSVNVQPMGFVTWIVKEVRCFMCEDGRVNGSGEEKVIHKCGNGHVSERIQLQLWSGT